MLIIIGGAGCSNTLEDAYGVACAVSTAIGKPIDEVQTAMERLESAGRRYCDSVLALQDMNESLEFAELAVRRFTVIIDDVIRHENLKQNYKFQNKYYEQKNIISKRCKIKNSVGRRSRSKKPQIRNRIRDVARERQG